MAIWGKIESQKRNLRYTLKRSKKKPATSALLRQDGGFFPAWKIFENIEIYVVFGVESLKHCTNQLNKGPVLWIK